MHQTSVHALADEFDRATHRDHPDDLHGLREHGAANNDVGPEFGYLHDRRASRPPFQSRPWFRPIVSAVRSSFAGTVSMNCRWGRNCAMIFSIIAMGFVIRWSPKRRK